MALGCQPSLIRAMIIRHSSRRLNFRSLKQRTLSNVSPFCYGFKTYSRRLADQVEAPSETDESKRMTLAKQSLINSYGPPSDTKSTWDKLRFLSPLDTVELKGYLGQRHDLNKGLFFVNLFQGGTPDKTKTRSIQICSAAPLIGGNAHITHDEFKSIEPNSLVWLKAEIQPRRARPKQNDEESREIVHIELKPLEVKVLNRFNKATIYTKDTEFPPEQRHLQLRSQSSLVEALTFRASLAHTLRSYLVDKAVLEVETPLLFKPTPEGAREFLVPTRHDGRAYALSQSPQQYKQILMAGLVPNYFQFAKCFRDEDLRADRQPEFTQLDLEFNLDMLPYTVCDFVEDMLKNAWNGIIDVAQRKVRHEASLRRSRERFPSITYEEAMMRFGSDKPDVRLGMELMQITNEINPELKSMVSHLDNPIVELYKLHVSDSAKESASFIQSFMDSPSAKPFEENPDGAPGIFIFDPRKPLNGLSAFGFRTAEQLTDALALEEGDLLAIQARKDEPFQGAGSSALGNLRTALYKAAVEQKMLPEPKGFEFLWVTDFPMFSPTSSAASEPGQGGAAGLKATHHPFTAPASPVDLELLFSDPLKAKAAHYDLVVNGVELGGGSRRIHVRELQEYVFRDVLRMPEERVQQFEHLLRALGDGAPPHGGFAIGFDRLVAVMLGRESVKDVMAFPKSGAGEDRMCGAPGAVGDEQWGAYGLRRR